MVFKPFEPIKISKKFLDNGDKVIGLVYNRKTTKYGVKGVDINVKLFRNKAIYRIMSETVASGGVIPLNPTCSLTRIEK